MLIDVSAGQLDEMVEKLVLARGKLEKKLSPMTRHDGDHKGMYGLDDKRRGAGDLGKERIVVYLEWLLRVEESKGMEWCVSSNVRVGSADRSRPKCQLRVEEGNNGGRRGSKWEVIVELRQG